MMEEKVLNVKDAADEEFLNVLSVPFEQPRKKEKKRKRSKTAIFLICLFYGIIVLLPFYVIVVMSITPLIEFGESATFIWFPENPTISSYIELFTDDPMVLMTGVSSILMGFGNSLWIALLTCTINVFMSGLAAYAYAKLHFRGKEIFFMIEIGSMMLPRTTMLIPSFVYFNAIGWGQGFLPLIIPMLFGGGGAVFFMRSYMHAISNEILDAAKIDGLGFLNTYVKIIIPLSFPAFIAQFIFLFVGSYNNYQGPLLYLYSNPKWYTLQLALSNIQTIFKDPNQQCAAAIIALVPLITLYIAFQRLFIEGIAVGGGKE